MSCMNHKMRGMTRANIWILSPLAAWYPAIVESHEANMILWNMVLLGVLCGTHFVISRVPYLQKWKQWLMHPYLSLTVASLLYQGSTFAA